MKKLAMAFALMLVAGLVYAQDPPGQPPDTPSAAAYAKKTQQISAEVVTVDAVKKTLTIKAEGLPEDQTLPVEGKALVSLKTVKAGEKYTLLCKNDAAGKLKSVVEIKQSMMQPESR